MAIYLKAQVGLEQIGVVVAELTEQKNAWHGEVHSHAAYELQVLLKGSCQVDVDGTIHTIQTHQAILTAPNQHHRTVSVDGAYERYGMLFSVGVGPLQEALEREVQGCRVYDVTEEIEALCRYIFLEWDRCSEDVRSFLQNQMGLLLQSNFRVLGIREYGIPDGTWPNGRMYTSQIDKFFENHLAKPGGMELLAEELHLSRSQVNRVIKEHYGISFREKLVQTRMARAVWLLCHTDDKMDQIADQVGYRSVSSFYEMFRSRFGISPEQYRRDNRK